MELWDACVKGAVQGLTEFLPVSSTAHLMLYDALLEHWGLRATPLTPLQEECFDIVLHVGTLGAVLLYYWKDWLALLKSSVAGLPFFNVPAEANTFTGSSGLVWHGASLLKALALGFVTTSVIALGVIKLSEKLVFNTAGWHAQGIHDVSEYYLANPKWALLHLAVTGIFLWLAEVLSQKRQGTVSKEASLVNASVSALPASAVLLKPSLFQGFLVGLFQSFAAIFHGLSRSGSTMTAGMLTGFNRQQAAHFAFLLSAPIFMAVALYAALKLSSQPAHLLQGMDWTAMLVGAFVAFLVGYACIAGFIAFLGRFSLKGFALYVWALSVFLAFSGWIH